MYKISKLDVVGNKLEIGDSVIMLFEEFECELIVISKILEFDGKVLYNQHVYSGEKITDSLIKRAMSFERILKLPDTPEATLFLIANRYDDRGDRYNKCLSPGVDLLGHELKQGDRVFDIYLRQYGIVYRYSDGTIIVLVGANHRPMSSVIRVSNNG